MFVESKMMGWGRDHFVQHYPADRVLKRIVASVRERF
jgi:hypothetical protein